MAGFVHLHNYSEFSLLQAPLSVSDLVQFAATEEMGAIALTDRGNLFGAIAFQAKASEAGIRPILGLEVRVVADRFATDRKGRGRAYELVLLAENQQGWLNLMKITSFGYLEGLYDGAPEVDLELLGRHREGIICLTGGYEGALAPLIREGDLDGARARLTTLLDLFGVDHLFVEIFDHGIAWEQGFRSMATDLARELGARLVATNQCHYRSPEHASTIEVQWAVRLSRTIDDPTWPRLESDQYHLRTVEEMAALFVDCPDALSNTVEIADRCEVDLDRGDYLLPEFPLPEGFEAPIDYLEHISREGAIRRYGQIDDVVEERLAYELKVIGDMGFAGYFLIVGDFVRAAQEREIPVGPGRGSAAGSLVCYSIGITDVDPLAHDLLFERFLNPERVSMPDIDIDFCFEGRERVIDYVVQTYGKKSVCQIITFGKMLARGVVRDVGRAMGWGFGEVDRIAKMVPEELKMTLNKALEQSEELRNARDEDPRVDRLIHNCLQLEGKRRHSSIHAAGVLIAPGDLVDSVPLHRTNKDEITTQWDMNEVEKMGLLKMDFLGLRTLTVIDKALKWLPELGGPAMKAAEIPLDDPAVYAMLGHGSTVGVFQLESSGMQEILRKLKPSGFGDITAVNALYRPGPLGTGMVDDFIDRKHGRKEVQYLHPILEPILETTYGVILYQEQVMRIASDMAGYSLGMADQLRRAMGKKKESEMARHKAIFIEGAQERGVARDIAGEVFDLMAYFAGYGFNKSHSAAYAVLAVQTAWLKTHYPAAFMASALTSEMGNTTRVVILSDEVRRLGLSMLPPDVNTCTADFRPVEGGVRFGLGAVKNVGVGAIDAIVEARERLGRGFENFYEFCEEIDLGRVNRRVIEALIVAGALDALPGRREQKVAALDLALARAQRRARDRDRGQASLFGGEQESALPQESLLPDCAEWTTRERLSRERELVGLYLSGHPLDDERHLLEYLRPSRAADVSQLPVDQGVVLCGVVSAMKTVPSRKSGQLIAFITVEDLSGAIEIIGFGDAYEKHRLVLAESAPLVFVARTTRREGDDVNRLILDKAMTLDDACSQLVREVHLRVPVTVGGETVATILGGISAHPGSCPLTLHVLDGDEELPVQARRAAVAPVPDLLHQFVAALGEPSVRLDVVPLHQLAAEVARPAWKNRAAAAAG